MAKTKSEEKVSKENKKANKKKGRIAKRIGLAILGIFLIGIITTGIIGTYVYRYCTNYINGECAINLDEYKETQNQTSFVYGYNKDGKLVEINRLFGSINRVWVDIENTNDYIAKCYIAAEDKRFYEHNGVDWKRTASVALQANGQGGSTITQQLIKNLTEEDDVTFVRKFHEILNALNLEKYYSKEEIVEAYINTVYLSHGCYGVKTAAETYFGKDISKLNLAECASLAAITKYPTYYDPILNPENNKARQEWCLKEMLEQGMITQDEYTEAVNYDLQFNYTEKETSKNDKPYSWYTDALIKQVIDDLMAKYGYTQKKASKMINYGGLRIYSAVDLSIQKDIDSIFANRDYVGDGTVQASMAILAYDGRVVGISGGIGKKTGRLELNRAVDSPRQPGSTIKPVSVYGPAIDTGAAYWSKSYQDSPSQVINGQPWPKNQFGQGGGGYVTLQYGLAQSMNTIAARCLLDVGLDTSYEYVTEKFKLGHLIEEYDKSYAPLAVGGMRYGATTLEMAAAFQAFGNGGTYNQPYFYYKVTDADGNVLLDRSNYDSHKAIEPSSAEIMNKLLRTVMQYGTGTPYNVSGQVTFGKTGTTDDDHDRWFVGGTPYYVGAVWYGYDTPQEIYYYNNNPAGNLFKYVMDKVHSGLSEKEFPYAPSGVTDAYYCTATGMIASSGCPSQLGYFRSDNMPGYCQGNHGGGSDSYEDDGETTTSDGGGSSEDTTATTEATDPPETEAEAVG